MRLLAILLLAHSSLAAAAPRRLSQAIMNNVSHHVDAGIEATLLASAGREAQFGALGIDLAIGIYADGLEEAPLRRRFVDRLLDRPAPPPRPWPLLARPRIELHAGAAIGLDGEHHQARFALASAAGPVGLGVAVAREWNDINAATAVGPELRLRHRYGPRARSPSLGLVLRSDIFVTRRYAHDDRISIGVFGMFDIF